MIGTRDQAPPAELATRSWRSVHRTTLIGYAFVAPALIYLLCTSIYPILDIAGMSVSDVNGGVRTFVGLRQYDAAVRDTELWSSVRTTAIFTVSSVLLHLAVGLTIALLLNEAWFSTGLRNLCRGLLILPWVFSSAAAGLMWSLLYHPFGLFNYLAIGVFGRAAPLQFLGDAHFALWSVVAVNAWKSYPFYMIAILGGLQGIAIELYEAAKVDGAGRWQRFWRITVPQLRPVLVAISTVDLITTFGHVDLINMLTRGGPGVSTETIAYYTYRVALVDGKLNYGAALSMLMLLLLTVVTIFYLRMMARRAGADNEAGF